MAMFSACDKGEDVKEFKDENATVKALTIEATLPSAQGEGMKTAFTAKDFLRIRFAKADGTSVGRTQILRGEAAEGKTRHSATVWPCRMTQKRLSSMLTTTRLIS